MNRNSRRALRAIVAASLLAAARQLVADADTPLPGDDANAVALYQACGKPDVEAVKNLILSGAPVDGQVGAYRFTPLINAASDGYVEIVKCLLDYHANINLPDKEGSTALLHACFEGKTDCALALIDAGADVNHASQAGRTPLMYAADKGDDRVVQALLAHKAAVNANCSGGPALLWAVGEGHLSTAKLLGDAGANPNLLPGSGDSYTALACAASRGDGDMIDYLIGIKADINGADHEGETALMAAADWKKPDAVARLLAAGANPDLRDKDGETALMMASRHGQLEVVRALIEARADVNLANNQGNTALLLAGDTGESAIVDAIKAAGAKDTSVRILPKGPDGLGLTAPQAWALAVGAIYAQRNGGNPRVLGEGGAAKGEQTMLKRDWGVGDKASLLKEVNDLRTHGHHETFRAQGAKFDQMSDDDFEKLVDAHEDNEATIRGLRASYRKWKERTGLGWDLCRAANIIDSGYAARYLSADEAWEQLMLIARQAQARFASWQELSDNFLDGREIWANQRDPRFEACAQLLLNPNDPNSPWNKSPWKTPLPPENPAPASTTTTSPAPTP